MSCVTPWNSLSASLLSLALMWPYSDGLAQVNVPPDGFGILPDEVGVYYSPATTSAISASGLHLNDAAPDGEIVKAATGEVLWVLRQTPVSSAMPAPGPLDEVDVHRRNSSGQWIYETTLLPPLVAAGTSEFGASVVASGHRLFIGAPGALNSASVAAGVVYVYEFDGTTLTPVQTIELPDGAAGDRFGAALAVDGARLLVGAPGRDRVDGATTWADAGAIHFFERGSGWSLARSEWSSQPQSGAQFGFSVALSGRRIVVGAPYEDGEFNVGGVPTTLNDAGAVYLGRWDAPASLLAYKNLFSTYAPVQAAMGGLAQSHFGWSVAADDHMRVTVSMPDSSWTAPDNMSEWDSGLVMVMHWNGEMSPDEAFVRTSFTYDGLPAGARFGEHVEVADGEVDFGIRTGQRSNNVPVNYYALEAVQAQPGALVGSVEAPRRVGDLVAADLDDEVLTLAIPSTSNPYGTFFEVGSTGELRAKSSLATLLDGVYPLDLTVSDGTNPALSRRFHVEVTGAIADADRDKMADAWEAAHGLNPAVNDAALDPDEDGLTNLQEYTANKDPMDPEGPLLMGGYIDLRPFVSHSPQDAPTQGTVIVADGGQGLALTGNRWVRVPFNYTVTPNTVIEFEFRGTVQGEIHAVGLDNDLSEGNAQRFAQVWGITTNFTGSIPTGDFDAYKHHATDWATHRVRIGQSFTGDTHYLVIANDDDELPQDSSTEVRKIRVYEAPIMDASGYVNLRPFSGYALAYDGDKPKQGSATATEDGSEIEVVGNRWLQWLVNYNVTPKTTVEFSYRSDIQGEIHGLGLDEDTQLNNAVRLFQIHGTQPWANALSVGTSDWYNAAPGTWKDYRLSVGKHYTGVKRYLILGNDHDVAVPNATARFKNVRIYEAADSDNDQIPDWWEVQWGTDPDNADATANPDNDSLNNFEEYQNNSDPLDPEGPLLMGGYLDLRPYVSHTAQDVPATGTVTVENKGESMKVTGNRWVRVPFDYTVTENTVMEFEFRGVQQGEVHAVGLDDDTLDGNAKRLCQLWGTDVWTVAHQPGDYDGYAHHAPDWKTYRIRIGKLNTGAMRHFFIVNDDDVAPQNSSMEIRKVKFYEASIYDAQGHVDLRYWSGYGLVNNAGDSPKSGSVAVENSGREVSITGNRWLQVLVDYPVTPRTVVAFSYRGDVEGETHGLGLDENTNLADALRVFRIHGTQASGDTLGTKPSLRYRNQGSWRQYQLPVGRTYTGQMRYLVLANDDDRASPTASARFKDIKIYEQADADADGMPDAWETAHAFNPNYAGDAALDPDHDGLTNLAEYDAGTDPDTPDTDEDSLQDKLSADRLAGYWQMDELGTLGREIVDSTPSLAHGAALDQAPPESEAGIAGTDALHLGLNNLARVLLPPDLLEMQPDTTLSFWMRSSSQGEMSVVSAPSATNDNAYLVLLKDQFLRLYTGVSSTDYVEWEPGLNDGSWHHVVVVREGTAGKARLYVDGQFEGERTATFVTSDIDLVVLGHEADSVNGDYLPSQRFRGFLDEVRFYQRALTPAEAATLFLWQPRLQDQADLDHDGMPDAWEAANDVTNSQVDHDGDGRTNVQEFLAGSDPWDYYNGRPPVLGNIFSGSSSTDLRIKLGLRDPGLANDDSWKAYVNGVNILNYHASGGSSSDFVYSPWLYLPVGITGSFTFELILDSNGDGSSFGLDLIIHPDSLDMNYIISGFTTTAQGIGYTFTIDVPDDTDNDGLMNAVEVIMTTDPLDSDSDDDGLPDGWEVAYDLDPKSSSGDNGAGADKDGDGLTNLDEFTHDTSPQHFDTDGDLLPDGWEVAKGAPFDPAAYNDRFADTDGDGLTDFDEKVFQTNPLVADTDADGTSDGDEVSQGGLPNDATDSGLAPAFPADPAQPQPGDAWTLRLEVGDPTGGNSERYTLVAIDAVSGQVVLEHEGTTFGEVSARAYSQFRFGRTYKFKVRWNGSDPKLNLAQPDFDGVASIKAVGPPVASTWSDLGYRLFDAINTTTSTLSPQAMVFATWNNKTDFQESSARHEAVLILLDGLQTDTDSDGASDEAESVAGTNPLDADSDDDGVADGYEIAKGLDPLDGRDALDDKDGDRVPNIYEYNRGTDAGAANSLVPDVTVDPAVTTETATVKKTISAAITAANGLAGDWKIIFVKQGVYPATLSVGSKRVAILGERGPTPPEIAPTTGNTALSITHADVVVDGFIIRHQNALQSSRGVSIAVTPVTSKVRLSNCFIQDNHQSKGSGVYITNGVGLVDHCTIFRNGVQRGSGVYAFAPVQGLGIAVESSASLRLRNSVLWNTGSPSGSSQIWGGNPTTVEVSNSIVLGGEFGASGADPLIDRYGCLLPGSPAIGPVGSDAFSIPSTDIHGEPRTSPPDLGADEYLDSDSDGLADWWETRFIGNLASNGTTNPDGDGLTHAQEYLFGSNPSVADADGDGANDGAEQAAGTSPWDADTDDDGIPDGYEISKGLDPHDYRDALEDKDGDRIPNIYEFNRSWDANSATSPVALTPDVTVDPAVVTETASVKKTIGAALSAAKSTAGDWKIVLVKQGTYPESGLSLGTKRILLMSERTVSPAVIASTTTSTCLTLSLSGSVVDGMVIRHTSPFNLSGGGVAVSASGYLAQTRLVNCVIMDNAALIGSGIVLSQGELSVDHCTIANNRGDQRDGSGGQGLGFHLANSTKLRLRNSIVWNPTSTAGVNQFVVGSNAVVEASHNMVLGGEQGGVNADPLLDRYGYLRAGSPAINPVGGMNLASVTRDTQGELRTSSSDWGADEYLDFDADGLPDSWELRFVGNLASTGGSHSDGDTLTNAQEYAFGSNPIAVDSDGDGAPDHAEQTAGTDPWKTDSDLDAMADGYELANGLNPLNYQDALADKDGDRIPNVYEFARGTDAAVAGALSPHFTVDPAGGGTHTTVAAAVAAANGLAEGYGVILVKSGVYDEAVTLNTKPVLLVGEQGEKPPELARSTSSAVVSIASKDVVVDGFVIRHSNPGASYRGFEISLGAAYEQSRIVNCIIRDNAASSGGAVNFDRGELTIEHCTLADNKASSGQGEGIAFTNNSTAFIRNCVVWNPSTVPGSVQVYATPASDLQTSHNLVLGGPFGSISGDPVLDGRGRLLSSSPAIDAGQLTAASPVLRDIQGELRSSSPDIGADELIDSDSDTLPDWWETKYFGNLTKVATGDDDLPSLDGLNNWHEYLFDLDPTKYDTDGNGINDRWEAAWFANLRFPYRTAAWLTDSDGDGLTDGEEAVLGSNPNLADTNGDGIRDFMSLMAGIEPTAADTDGDGVSNADELVRGTSPVLADSDGDGVADGLDAFPLDSSRWNAPAGSPSDVTPPQIFLDSPHDATPL